MNSRLLFGIALAVLLIAPFCLAQGNKKGDDYDPEVIGRICGTVCSYAAEYADPDYEFECNRGWKYALEFPGTYDDCVYICEKAEGEEMTEDSACVTGCRCGKRP
eukprot:GILI01004049.1.p1 GENE.GILI01004049.1~~GILI01004049.1.p1  ORF type:complete len:114 (+),score=28.25 GILI01004049.1:29-343(+)